MEKLNIIDINKAYRLTAPNPYVLVTTLDKQNKPNAIGVSWVTRTSINPFLIMISIDTRRYSHNSILYHKEFVVNYPTKKLIKGAYVCGTKSGRNVDKISLSDFTLIDSINVKVPTLKDCLVSLECKLINNFTTGDHTAFIGEVACATGDNTEDNKHLYAYHTNFFAIDNEGNIDKSIDYK